MDPYTQQVAIVTMEVIGGLGLMGIIAGWRLAAGKQKLKAREYELEAMRLENEARSLELEDKRLSLLLDDNSKRIYDQLPR